MWKSFLRNKKASENEAVQLDEKRLPQHIAIIMDGNGRWAQKRGLPRTAGHKKGVDALRNIVRYASSIHIQYLTVYAFSTENWKRPQDEVDFLMRLFSHYLDSEVEEMHKNNVRLRFIGAVEELSHLLQQKIKAAEQKTCHNTGLNLNVAVNYGGRAEILRAAKKLVLLSKEQQQAMSEAQFSEFFYTASQPDIDLLLRTGGDERISNFLLWQAAYAELSFVEKCWPSFTEEDLASVLMDYANRDRRFGGLK